MTDKITTHVADAIKRLLYQFREKEKIEGWVAKDAAHVQDLEDAAHALIEGRTLQNATGATLNRWGTTLSEARALFTDPEYRAMLFFKIQRNISTGTPEELIAILRDLVQGDSVQYVDEFPGTVAMSVIGARNEVDADFIKSLMQLLSPAGVRVRQISIGYSAHPFVFAGHPNPQGRGFETIPPTGNGGVFATIL